jgi:hypothetical protein
MLKKLSCIILIALVISSCSKTEENSQKVVYDASPVVHLDTNFVSYSMKAGYYTFDSIVEVFFDVDSLACIIDITEYKSGHMVFKLLEQDSLLYTDTLIGNYNSETILLNGIKPDKVRFMSEKFTGNLSFKLTYYKSINNGIN